MIVVVTLPNDGKGYFGQEDHQCVAQGQEEKERALWFGCVCIGFEWDGRAPYSIFGDRRLVGVILANVECKSLRQGLPLQKNGTPSSLSILLLLQPYAMRIKARHPLSDWQSIQESHQYSIPCDWNNIFTHQLFKTTVVGNHVLHQMYRVAS